MPEIGGFGDPEKGWYWMGKTMPDLPAMQRAHDEFTDLLRSEGVDVILVDKAAPGAHEADLHARQRHRRTRAAPSLPVWRGGCAAARNCRSPGRWPRPDARSSARIHGTAVFEGGGFAFIDDKTAVCTVSVACNPEGVRQVESHSRRSWRDADQGADAGLPYPYRRRFHDGRRRDGDRQRQRTALPLHRISAEARHQADRTAAGRQRLLAQLSGGRARTRDHACSRSTSAWPTGSTRPAITC